MTSLTREWSLSVTLTSDPKQPSVQVLFVPLTLILCSFFRSFPSLHTSTSPPPPPHSRSTPGCVWTTPGPLADSLTPPQSADPHELLRPFPLSLAREEEFSSGLYLHMYLELFNSCCKCCQILRSVVAEPHVVGACEQPV